MNRTAAEAYLDSPPHVPGDRVHLIAASSPTDAAGFDHALATLEGWGLEVVVGEHVRAVHPELPYLAGTDEQRRADLEAAWCDPRTSAVIALRGGIVGGIIGGVGAIVFGWWYAKRKAARAEAALPDED